LEPKNYRPVAILVILSKVLERIVFKQIVAEAFQPQSSWFSRPPQYINSHDPNV
jgi:hypothetical protein